jgi:hypothetical protein
MNTLKDINNIETFFRIDAEQEGQLRSKNL